MRSKIIAATDDSCLIVLPAELLAQLNWGENQEVVVEVSPNQILVRSAAPEARPRHGWSEAFRQMAERGDDVLLDEDGDDEW